MTRPLKRGRLARLCALFAATREGRLKVTLDTVFPLSDARKAHETIEGRGARGHLLLEQVPPR